MANKVKRKSVSAFALLLLAWVLMAEGSVQGIIICVHEGAHREGGDVHFHLGGFCTDGHHPCRIAQSDMGDTHRDVTCRHIPVGMDPLNNLSAGSTITFKRAILMCTFEVMPQSPILMSCAKESPSYLPFPSKDTAIRKTTVLII